MRVTLALRELKIYFCVNHCCVTKRNSDEKQFFVPDSARNFPVSLCRKARPGFFWISIFGACAGGASDMSEGFSLISSSDPDSRELIISFARDSSEFWNTVPSLLSRQKVIT